MKKTFRFMLAAFAIVVAASCAQELDNPDAIPQEEVELVPMTISVGGETKTTVGDDDKTINWCEDDVIAVFDKTGEPREFTIVEGKCNGKTATFEGMVAAGTTDFTAVYPYSAAVSVSNGIVTVNAAETQTLGEANIAEGATLSVASFKKGDAAFEFKTAIGYLRVDVDKDDVTSIIVKGSNIAGQATFNAAGELQEVKEGKNQVTLTPNADVFAAGSYYLTLLPGTTAENFNITLVRKNEFSAQMTAEKSVTIPRNGGFFLDSSKLTFKYVIKDAVTFQNFLSKANTFAATDIAEIVDDIDLTGVTIATAPSFKGTLDGGGHSLKNWTSDATALFTTISGTVKNLIIDASSSLTFPATGGRFGFIANEMEPNSILDNCINNAAINLAAEKLSGVVDENRIIGGSGVSVKALGALVGVSEGSIRNCINNGNITITVSGNTGPNLHLGGIAGYADLTDQIAAGGSRLAYDNCTNAGDITYTVSGTASYAFIGGVSGGTNVSSITADNTGYRGTLNNCTNTGNVSYSLLNGGTLEENSGKGGSANYTKVGGVVGYWEGDIAGCVNGMEGSTVNGKVSFQVPTLENTYAATAPSFGGVAGYAMYNVTDCINYGPLYVKGTFAGGTQTNPGTGVNGGILAGGIAAQVGPYSNGGSYLMNNCHNFGDVKFNLWMAYGNGTEGHAGGVVGYCKTKISNCSNNATVTIESKCHVNYLGGVAGCLNYDATNLTNDGTVNVITKRTSAGVTETYKQCTGKQYVAGVVGFATNGCQLTTIINQKALNVTVQSADLLSAQLVVGGAVAYAPSSKFTTIKNKDIITVNQASSSNGAVVGGAVAWAPVSGGADNSAAITYNCNEQTGTVWCGGCVGYNTATTISGVSNAGKVTINGTSASTLNFGGLSGEIPSATSFGGTNSGELVVNIPTVTTLRMGGLAGITKKVTTLSGENSGAMSDVSVGSTCYVGGLLGSAEGSGTLKGNGLKHTQAISLTGVQNAPYVGGLIARAVDGLALNLTDCSNSGSISLSEDTEISGQLYVGGIVGFNNNGSSEFVLCSTTGNLSIDIPQGTSASGNCYFSGISASSGLTVDYKTCTNTGDMTLNCPATQWRMGGIAAYNQNGAEMSGNRVESDILVKSASSTIHRVGGILGYGNLTNYLNNTFVGTITSEKGKGKLGGMVGSTNQNNATYKGCVVNARISGCSSDYCGLFVGSTDGTGVINYNIGVSDNPCYVLEGSSINNTQVTNSGWGTNNEYLVGTAVDRTVTITAVSVVEAVPAN